MCGFVGMILSPAKSVDENILGSMREKITHRGPDDWGHHIQENIGLASVRLSIIDLHNGKMPIYNDDESIVIVYNGEVYNHKKIRLELEQKGYQFKTNTDTEVILRAYEEYGEQCAGMFNGMFAFAIWDNNKKQLFMGRDQLGQKPLYFSHRNGDFLFASEIKSILKYPGFPREVSKTGLYSYLQMGYVIPPYSMYQDIMKVPPGHTLTYKDGKYELKEYWTIEYNPNYELTLDETIQNVREKMITAVESRMMSDVPVSAFLSGGVDSTVVTGIVTKLLGHKISTFTFGFSEKAGGTAYRFNSDIEHAEIVAKELGTKHKSSALDLDSELLQKTVRDIHWYLDEPCYAPTLVPLYFLSKEISSQYKVSLTGDGGDELFAGYDMYKLENKIAPYNYVPKAMRRALHGIFANSSTVPQKVRTLLKKGVTTSEASRYLAWKNIFDKNPMSEILHNFDGHQEFNETLEKHFTNKSKFNYAASLTDADIKLWISSHAQNAFDRMSMANSLETRSSFLDHTLVEFAQTIPIEYKLKENTTKWILKEAFKDVIPDNVLNRPNGGMLAPSSTWLRDHLKPMMDDLLSIENMKKVGLVNPYVARKIIDGHLDKSAYAMIPTWTLFSLHLWHRMFIENEDVNI